MTDLIRTISPRDGMYVKGFEAAYFRASQSALNCVEAALKAANRKRDGVRRILDLPCGHGRVLRALRSQFPQSEIVACDIDRDGVDFCKTTFGATPRYSNRDPTKVDLGAPFDLIWVGSLFTHLPEGDWSGFFSLFESALQPEGVLVFTVAGPFVASLIDGGELGQISQAAATALLEDFRRIGFGFAPYEPQADCLYGRAVASPAYVLRLVEQFAGLEVLLYHAKAWDGRQDVFAAKRKR